MTKTLLNNETVFITIGKCVFCIILPLFCKLKVPLENKNQSEGFTCMHRGIVVNTHQRLT